MTLMEKLKKSRRALAGALGGLFGSGPPDGKAMEKAEDALLEADLGWKLAEEVVRELPGLCSKQGISWREGLARILMGMLPRKDDTEVDARPRVTMVVGVNGSGKTTTVARLAAMYSARGEKVMMACADTFRAAAGEQLSLWGERLGVPVVTRFEGADPGAVAFDAVKSACARGYDRVLIDTAGRLPNRKGLLDELGKVHRVIGKAMEGAPHDVLLVLDGSVGQNALLQAEGFSGAVPVSGLVITKLDGTARGGAVFAMSHELGIPIHYIGTGEGGDDLSVFDPVSFTAAMVGVPEGQDADSE